MNPCLVKCTIYTVVVGGVIMGLLWESREPLPSIGKEHTHDDRPLSTMEYRYTATTASTNASGDIIRGELK